MESLKCDFEFDSIDFRVENLNHHKNLLWILHADKIPPHIGFSVEGLFFSLKVRGKDEFIPILKMLDILKNKKISSLVIELNTTFTEMELAYEYKQFDRAKDLESSCLVPIRELFHLDSRIKRLTDFLGFLQENNLINHVFGLNLTKTYKGIPHYTTEEIEFRLEKLKHAKG